MRYAACAQSRAACGLAAASAQLAAISSRSARCVDRPWICSISRNAASASASASPASPAASSTAHRSERSRVIGTFSRRKLGAAASRKASAAGRSPDAKAASARLSIGSAASSSCPIPEYSRAAETKSASALLVDPSCQVSTQPALSSARAVHSRSPARRSTTTACRASSRAAGYRPRRQNTTARRTRTRAARTPLDRPTRGLEGRQPGRRPAREDERYAQAGEHIGLALGRAGTAGLAQCLAQFTDPGLDVAVVAQHDPRGLMGHGGVIRARPSGEHGTRSAQRRPGPRRGQRDQIVHLAPTCRGRAPCPDHGPILGLRIWCGPCIKASRLLLRKSIGICELFEEQQGLLTSTCG